MAAQGVPCHLVSIQRRAHSICARASRGPRGVAGVERDSANLGPFTHPVGAAEHMTHASMSHGPSTSACSQKGAHKASPQRDHQPLRRNAHQEGLRSTSTFPKKPSVPRVHASLDTVIVTITVALDKPSSMRPAQGPGGARENSPHLSAKSSCLARPSDRPRLPQAVHKLFCQVSAFLKRASRSCVCDQEESDQFTTTVTTVQPSEVNLTLKFHP
jgi:hypothetical protein